MSNSTYLGANIPKLGFGAMRLPTTGGGRDAEIDLEQFKKMIDIYLERGFTYFDTAYVYHGGKSEVALREALVKRYPRDKFIIADKMPLWDLKGSEDYERIFKESLERYGVDYFDFYLLHNLGLDKLDDIEKTGGWDFMKRIKAEGRAKHIGFSCHDTAEHLDEILTRHPEAEFVQLQINYIDWDNDKVQSKKCYETARRHNIPVIIMEPVKGGSLASMGDDIQNIFKAANPEASVPSWAIRFCASLEGIVTVLSGMSNIEQVLDNTGYMMNFKPLSDSERKTIAKVVDAINAVPKVPCTACRYCVDDCPQKIDIPGIIEVLNNYSVYNNLEGSKGGYGWATSRGGKASDCIQCASCESHCPQKIEIIETLKKAAGLFE
jgi:predicted aldo/keto reductase-like oxidoreductase